MSIPQTIDHVELTTEDTVKALARAHYWHVYFAEEREVRAIEHLARALDILDDVTRLSTQRIREEAS